MKGSPLHSVSVAGVAFNYAGRVLLVRRRDNGEWQAPGGVLELGETFENGVVREVLEETGIRIEVGPLTGVYKNMRKGVVALVYRCSPVAGSARPSDETSEVAWWPVPEALDLMAPAFAIRVEDAANSSGKPASRAHDGVDLI